MVTSFDISQEIFLIDMLKALKSSLKHRRKHVLRSFRLYGNHAFAPAFSILFLVGEFTSPENSTKTLYELIRPCLPRQHDK